MIIKKIIPESSIDYRDKFGPVIFTSGCNFKCPTCHNPELIKFDEKSNNPKELTNELKNLKIKTDNGWYNGVCITGGEPTIHKNLPELIMKFKEIGLSVKLDTNGSNPGMLKKLLGEKLIDYVALDIKSNPELYSKVCGVDVDLAKIEESIKILSKLKKYEFRTTVVPIFDNGKFRWFTEKEVGDMVNWVKERGGGGVWVLQSFVSRDKNEILDEKFCKNKLPAEMHETPKNILEKFQKIISKYFDCEIR